MSKTTTEMRLVPIAKLVPYQNNARTHSAEQIKKLRSSLREFGFVNPVLIDRSYGVIAGHGRIQAAMEEGITEVPCVYVDHLTDAQKKAYILADNRMALDAGWDEELLKIELEELEGLGIDLGLTGFDEKELSDLFGKDTEIKDDEFDVEAELQKPTFSKAGDVWKLGRHTLICGDSTKQETYDTLLGEIKVNLVLTDPPYNVNYEGSAGKIKNDNMSTEKFYKFLLDAFTCIEKAMAMDASVYIFHADSRINSGVPYDAGFFCRVLYLEKAVSRTRTLTVSVAARTGPVRLEEKRQASVVHRQKRNHYLGVRQAEEKRRSSHNETYTAPGLPHHELLAYKFHRPRPFRRQRVYPYRL